MVYIKQIIVRLPDDKHQALKIKTIKDGVSIQGFVESIITEYLGSNMTATELVDKIKQK
ncbi:MAG: hypothetical protein WCQ63_06170 [Methanomethylophilus sp.]